MRQQVDVNKSAVLMKLQVAEKSAELMRLQVGEQISYTNEAA